MASIVTEAVVCGLPPNTEISCGVTAINSAGRKDQVNGSNTVLLPCHCKCLTFNNLD